MVSLAFVGGFEPLLTGCIARFVFSQGAVDAIIYGIVEVKYVLDSLRLAASSAHTVSSVT